MTIPDTDTLAGLLDYDAGLLNDWGDGNVEWWQDYLRAEIGRANEFWREQVENVPVLRSAPPVGARVIAEKAYLAGFNAAGEGYNGEWPFHDKGISPDTDEGWLIGRDMTLAALLPAGEGE